MNTRTKNRLLIILLVVVLILVAGRMFSLHVIWSRDSKIDIIKIDPVKVFEDRHSLMKGVDVAAIARNIAELKETMVDLFARLNSTASAVVVPAAQIIAAPVAAALVEVVAPAPVSSNIMAALKYPVKPDIRPPTIKKFMSNTLLLGSPRKKRVFLVIGLPTVRRDNAYYLLSTLEGLVNSLTTAERDDVTLMVFVADFNEAYRAQVKADVSQKFAAEVASGMIMVVAAPHDFYPDMHNLVPFYGDKPERVQWRSKQSMDYAFLYYSVLEYSKSDYFMQIEDDVQTEAGYIQSTKLFIEENKKKNWAVLELGPGGFIGMLYRAKHLLALANFSRLFFWHWPIDWTFRIFNEIYIDSTGTRYFRKHPLFKHIGKMSSLKGQIRKIEKTPINAEAVVEVIPRDYQLNKPKNPPATLSTSIKHVIPHSIDLPYGSQGFFWGSHAIVGSWVEIKLHNPTLLKRIVFASGSPKHPDDAFLTTELLVATGDDVPYILVHNELWSTAVIDFQSPIGVLAKKIQLKITAVRVDSENRIRWLLIREILLEAK